MFKAITTLTVISILSLAVSGCSRSPRSSWDNDSQTSSLARLRESTEPNDVPPLEGPASPIDSIAQNSKSQQAEKLLKKYEAAVESTDDFAIRDKQRTLEAELIALGSDAVGPVEEYHTKWIDEYGNALNDKAWFGDDSAKNREDRRKGNLKKSFAEKVLGRLKRQ